MTESLKPLHNNIHMSFHTSCLLVQRNRFIHLSIFVSPCLSGLSPSPTSSETQPAMRTVPYVPTVATPRPALTPSSARSPATTQCPSAHPEKCPGSGFSSSGRPDLHFRPNHKELSQSGVDSSGYSSSEAPYKKPACSNTSRVCSNRGDPSPGYRSRISSALYNLIGK